MAKRSERPNPTTVIGKNLLAVIDVEARRLNEPFSVNAWARRHKFVQTTIDRVLKGQDPSTALVRKIAAAASLEPWHMLIEDLDPQNPPVLYGAEQRKFIEQLKRKIGPEILEEGNTGPGAFDELRDKATSDATIGGPRPAGKRDTA